MITRPTQSRKRVKGQCPLRSPEAAPLVGFGATPQAVSRATISPTRAQQRRRQRSVPDSNFAHPQMRPPSCSIYHSHIVAPDGRDRVAGLSVIAAFSRKQGISPLRRRVGGNENRRMSAIAPDTPSQRTPMFLDFFRKLFILFPDSTAPSACAFSLLASAHST